MNKEGGHVSEVCPTACKLPSAKAFVLQEFTEVFCLVCFICEPKSEAQDKSQVK